MLYLIGSFLLFILLLLVIIVFVFKKSKAPVAEVKAKPAMTVESLVETLKTEKTDRKIIDGLLEKMLKNFPFPENERDANKHFEFVYRYAKNPLSTAKMIVHMQKELSQVNPKHAKLIEEFQMRGVEARKNKPVKI